MMDIYEVLNDLKEEMAAWSDEVLVEHVNNYERLKSIFETQAIKDEYTLERTSMVLALFELELTKRKLTLK